MLEAGIHGTYSAALTHSKVDPRAIKKSFEADCAARWLAALESLRKGASTADATRAISSLRCVITECELTLRCPCCAAPFVDFNGCLALECANCGADFCAVCLADCNEDAHAHIRRFHGNYFNMPLFESSHRNRRTLEVAAAVQKLAFDEPSQRALVAALSVDLPPLGIDLDDVLARAGVGVEVTPPNRISI